MTTFDQAVKAVQQHGAQFQHTLRSWVAYLGDGAGNVVSDTAKNRYFCRYPAADSPSSEVYAAGCPPVDGMRVMVGYSADQPKLVRILSWTDPALENTILPLQRHGDTHSYLQGDTTWIDWRQILTLKVQPYSGLLVYVNGGVLPRSGVDTYVLPQVVDMSGSVPNTINQGRYALLSLDTSGAVVITNGTPVTPGMSLDISSVPDTPSGNFRLAAVQLVYGQTTIQETTSRCDILDLRWPQETIAGSLAPGSIGGATAQYQYIVSGAGPTYTAQWSNGYLAITSGKTLTAQNNLTLSGTDGKALTLTGSLTIGADTSITGGGTIALGGFTLTIPATGTVALINYANAGYIETTSTFRLPTTSSTVGQILLNGSPVLHAYGSFNFFAGTSAGNFTLTASECVGVGRLALNNLTSGSFNTAIGSAALNSNQDGIDNNAFGRGALQANTHGSDNQGIGYLALTANLTGNQNVAVGSNALVLHTAGDGNLAIGADALHSNLTGASNVAIGTAAGYSNTGGWNVFIGQSTGYNNAGNSNVFIGRLAGYWETGSNTLFINNTNGANEADDRIKAMVYGLFSSSPASQYFTVNANFKAQVYSALTNTLQTIATLAHDSTGTPAAGFGTRQLFTLQSSTTIDQSAAALDVSWADATHATRKAKAILSVYDTAAREVLRGYANGSLGLLGVGLGADPAAILHIGASVTGAASLRIPAGTAPTAPAEGDQWNDSTQKADIAFLAGINQARVGCIYSSYADVTVSGTAAETTLLGGSAKGTLTLPANFWTVGKKIRIRGGGIHTMPGGSPTMQIRLYLGLVLIGDTTALVDKNDTNTAHSFDYQVTCITTGATGTVKCTGFMLHHEGTVDVNMFPFENTGTATVDTTAAMAVNLTVQFSTSTGTSITASNMTIEVLE